MRFLSTFIVLNILIISRICVCQSIKDTDFEEVSYLMGSIIEKEGKYLKLYDGTSWLLSLSSIAIELDEIVIVARKIEINDNLIKENMAYIDEDQIPIKLIEGKPAFKKGYLTKVVESLNDGAILKLNNNSLWSVPSYDQYDTGWWLTPYPALVTSDELYLINLNKIKKVWVKRMSKSSNSIDSSETVKIIKSWIVNDFDGLEYGKIFQLENNQIWKQTENYIWIYIAVLPQVTIFKSDFVYKMKVEGIEHAVRVVRVK